MQLTIDTNVILYIAVAADSHRIAVTQTILGLIPWAAPALDPERRPEYHVQRRGTESTAGVLFNSRDAPQHTLTQLLL